MLIKPDEREVTGGLGEIHVTHWEENKLYGDLGVCHISKIFRGPVVSVVQTQVLQSRRQMIASCSKYHKGESTTPSGFLWFLEATYPIPG